jgi:hypothetical protein
MKKFVLFAAAILFATAPALTAADKTWTGVLGDSKCNATHSKAEHASQTDDHDCVTKCVAAGAKHVFVAGGKTFQIANQDFAGLTDHAGHNVKLSGELKGDSITVSKIEMKAAAPAKAKK